ncbi:hypothetical protein ABW19_dt0202449 [Dactylella cylindrospora]|nr:hypothetical protein ABW19_dt0202449 [Dactylella cylindrospora]
MDASMPYPLRYTEMNTLGIFDPSSEDEQNVLLATLASFYLYRRAAHYTFTHRRRRNFYTLSLPQQRILQSISFQPTLDKLDLCIENNALFAEAILKTGCESFGINLKTAEKWKDLAESSDMEKARSTMKQFLRDWSREGAKEREECYGPILDAVERIFGHATPRCHVRVLVPGAGLGRLAFEICKKGYATEGNEFSYHQLVASNFVLNSTEKADQFTIHPFVLSFSHHKTRDNQARSISIPDVHPGSILNTPIEFLVPALSSAVPTEPSVSQPEVIRYRPSQFFSMSAGEFVESYNTYEAKGTFDCVATCFFIDTARNLMTYLETIRNVLVDGGVWINNGPLLWHWEGADASEANASEAASKKSRVKGFEEAEGQVEDAETLQLPTPNSHGHSHSHNDTTSHSHSHTHLDPSQFHSHSRDSPPSDPSLDWKGSLEFTLDEVFQLAGMYGFKIIEQKTCKTGYIEDENAMAKYIYEPKFWVAVKTGEVSQEVKASLKRFEQEEEEESQKGKGKDENINQG